MKEEKKPKQPNNININLDTTPILYTDSVFITTNPDGMVFDVCQKVVNSNQFRVVTRFGMSRVHAKKFVEEISKLLALTESSTHKVEKS